MGGCYANASILACWLQMMQQQGSAAVTVGSYKPPGQKPRPQVKENITQKQVP